MPSVRHKPGYGLSELHEQPHHLTADSELQLLSAQLALRQKSDEITERPVSVGPTCTSGASVQDTDVQFVMLLRQAFALNAVLEFVFLSRGPYRDTEESGMVVDFSDLKKTVRQEVVDPLDHEYLNRIIDNPTAERIAVWIWDRLAPKLQRLVEIELHETEDCSVVYRGE